MLTQLYISTSHTLLLPIPNQPSLPLPVIYCASVVPPVDAVLDICMAIGANAFETLSIKCHQLEGPR